MVSKVHGLVYEFKINSKRFHRTQKINIMVLNTPISIEKAKPENLDQSDILRVQLIEEVKPLQNEIVENAVKFEIKETTSSGQGMFATENILPGTVILRYVF